MSFYESELEMRKLLAPLSRVEPVAVLGKKRSRRPVLVAGFVAAALLATGIAVADGVNPFAGIGAANHAQTSRDVLYPAVVARIRATNAEIARLEAAHAAHPSPMGPYNFDLVIRRIVLLPDTARLLGVLPSGRRVYVMTTTSHLLCVLFELDQADYVDSCGNPLTQTQPVTIGAFDRVKNGPHATPLLNYGIAQNGVIAVSFRGGRREHTVQVKNNIWFYEGDSSALRSITVHYADGRTKTITH
jgi:hypothetical protein